MEAEHILKKEWLKEEQYVREQIIGRCAYTRMENGKYLIAIIFSLCQVVIHYPYCLLFPKSMNIMIYFERQFIRRAEHHPP